LSSITNDDRVDVITQTWMMLKLLFRQQAEWRKERNREKCGRLNGNLWGPRVLR
jgi:hypothetical protein